VESKEVRVVMYAHIVVMELWKSHDESIGAAVVDEKACLNVLE